MTNKELQQISEELTEQFLDYLKIKSHPQIVSRLGSHPFSHIVITNVFFYENRINQLEMFWERKLFDYFILKVVGFGVADRYEIVEIHLSPLRSKTLKIGNRYDFFRTLRIEFKNIYK